MFNACELCPSRNKKRIVRVVVVDKETGEEYYREVDECTYCANN